MLSLEARVQAFGKLGNELRREIETESILSLTSKARAGNTWFNEENSLNAIRGITENLLQIEKLESWTRKYNFKHTPRQVGVIMAGNIPAVGFHDALCVLISGHHLLVKTSSDDAVIIPYLLNKLIEIEPSFSDFIHYPPLLNKADAFIGTGSNNSSRYFERYFSGKPHIIRKNRTSVALLDGTETDEDLLLLTSDVVTYYGLGCRNVSKLYVPIGYDFDRLYQAIQTRREYCTYHHKYFNNYEYNRSILLINRTPHLDNGFLIIQENSHLVSPISVLFFETYANTGELVATLKENSDSIQCIAGNTANGFATVPFGKTQRPELDDYADGVDTMQFLANL